MNSILIIILIFLVWSSGGSLWAQKYNVKYSEIHKYTIPTIIIGGPVWWILIFLIKISKIKPRKDKEVKGQI